MAAPTPMFEAQKINAAPAQSSLIARLGMTVCFLATTGLLVAGLRSVPAAETGLQSSPAIAVAAHVRSHQPK
jgi:hypothetical protein